MRGYADMDKLPPPVMQDEKPNSILNVTVATTRKIDGSNCLGVIIHQDCDGGRLVLNLYFAIVDWIPSLNSSP
jgi:hypothetical protein